jgi:hypothetical protein
MSSAWTHAWNSTPQIDCGLCGFVRCACFARAVLVGGITPDSCPVLSLPRFSNQKTKFLSLVDRGIKGFAKPAPEMPKGGVLLTSTCKDRVDRVMAELRVSNGVKEGDLVRFPLFDSTILCDMLECLSSQFEVMKCSRDLGYARADTGEISVTLLQDGRINMRRMNDLEHVKRLFAMIERAVIPSVVCNCCGRDLLSILADGSKGAKSEHTVFKAGSSVILEVDKFRTELTRDAFSSHAEGFSSQAIAALDEISEYLRSNVDQVHKKTSARDRPDPKKARTTLVAMSLDNRIRGRESVVFKAQSLLWLIENGIKGLVQAEQLKQQSSGRQLHEIQEMLSSLAVGVVPELGPNEVSPDVFLAYAHLKRIDQALKALGTWNSD